MQFEEEFLKEAFVLSMEIFNSQPALRFGKQDEVPGCFASGTRAFFSPNQKKARHLASIASMTPFGRRMEHMA